MTRIIMNYNTPMIQNRLRDLEEEKESDFYSVMDELEALEDTVPVTTLSSYQKTESEQEEDDRIKAGEMDDSWLKTIATYRQEKPKARRTSTSSIFDSWDGKKGKKKKKKKDKDELTDFKTEFSNEEQILHNLLQDQIKFTDSLQKRYDSLEASKSAQRGIGKFTTDLIAAINQGRSTSLQIANAVTGLKKTTFELSMKEKKDKTNPFGDGENISEFSAQFLKQVLSQDRKSLSAYGDATPYDAEDSDDLFASISEEMTDVEREDDVSRFLKYEKMNITIYAIVNRDTRDWYLEARDEKGNVIDDYPLPEVSSLDINESTEIASDNYREKYPIIWT